MKIAICLSGHVRTYRDCVESVMKHLPNPGDADYFVHTYDTFGFRCGANGSDESTILPASEVQNVMDLYKPLYIMIEDNERVIAGSKPEIYASRINVQPETNINSVLSMYYSIGKSFELMSKHQRANNFEYDVVFRLRFDDLIKKFDFDLSTMEPNTLYMPEVDGLGLNAITNRDWPGFSWRGGLDDQFGFGCSKTMQCYGKVYKNIEAMYRAGVTFHPETMLKYQMQSRGFKHRFVDSVEFDLFRK